MKAWLNGVPQHLHCSDMGGAGNPRRYIIRFNYLQELMRTDLPVSSIRCTATPALAGHAELVSVTFPVPVPTKREVARVKPWKELPEEVRNFVLPYYVDYYGPPEASWKKDSLPLYRKKLQEKITMMLSGQKPKRRKRRGFKKLK